MFILKILIPWKIALNQWVYEIYGKNSVYLLTTKQTALAIFNTNL